MGTNRPSDLQGSLQRDGDGIRSSLSSSFAQEEVVTNEASAAATPPPPTTPSAGVGAGASGAGGRLRRGGVGGGAPSRTPAPRHSRRRLFGSHLGEDTLVEPDSGEGVEQQPQASSSNTSSSDQQADASAAAAAAAGAHRVLAARHLCPKCPKTFGSPGKLSQHMYSHTGERPFACQFCPKAFSSKFKLVRHMLIHSDQRQYTCQMCERTFHRKDHLKNHAKVHNPIKSTYTCERPGCDKEYSSLLSYRKHIAVHAAEDGNLECTMCGLKFASKDEIVFHLKVHAGSRTVKTAEDRKYRCDHCDRSFFTGKDVRRHMVVHTGKRDFLCQFCPQRFGRKDHLVRHIKKSHSSTGKKTKAKRAEAKTKSVESILVETGQSKTQASVAKLSSSSKPATITSGELFNTVSREASLMSEFEEPKDAKQEVFQSHFSEEHGCVVMIAPSGSSEVDEQIKNETSSFIRASTSSAPLTVVEMSQCVTVPSPATVNVMSCTNLLSPNISGTEMSNLVYEGGDDMRPSHHPQHVSSYHASDHQQQYRMDDNTESRTVDAILTPVDAHSFDQPVATSSSSSSSSSSYSAMIDSFGLELKPGDLDDLKPSDLDLKAEDLDLKPEDIGAVPGNPTSHRETDLERNISLGDLPLLIPILPRPHEQHLQMQQATTHFLAPDESRHLSRHIINLTAPPSTSELIVELPHFNIGSASQESTREATGHDQSNTTPLPRFNQAFQQQPPPPPPK